MQSAQNYIQRNRTWLQPLGHVWAFPNTMIGFLFGIAGRNRWQIQRRTIEIVLRTGPVLHICRVLKISAFTLGDCVLYAAEPCENLRQHESRHSAQYWLLGPFFLPVYFILLALRGYHDHPLEKDARRWEQEQCGCLYSSSINFKAG